MDMIGKTLCLEAVIANMKINKPKLQKRSLIWFGYSVFIWSLIYMIPHLYWVLGGTIGMSMLRPSTAELAEWKMITTSY